MTIGRNTGYQPRRYRRPNSGCAGKNQGHNQSVRIGGQHCCPPLQQGSKVEKGGVSPPFLIVPHTHSTKR